MTATILVVEDNPITRKLVRFTLEDQGFGVVDAVDGQSALDAFTNGPPISLVLQDLLLPDMDGFELVQKLRSLPGAAEVPILACSGLLSKLEEARMSAVGFDDVISKPVEPSRLMHIVRSHLPALDDAALDRFGRGRRALVVDDDPVQRKLVTIRLKRVGFSVTSAADGQDALERARELPPDVVVSDVLMPRLDGFGLCMSLRSDQRLAHVPVVLTTNSYVESADHDLARKAGANDLILRTPDLRDLMTGVRASLTGATPPSPSSLPSDAIERQRLERAMRQLERQVALNAGASQRCALLSAELAVLNGIADALASNEDIDAALRHALAACFDAGGISLGALYLCEAETLRVVCIGPSATWSDDVLRDFFGEPELLRAAIAGVETVSFPPTSGPIESSRRVLERAGASSALLVPFAYKQGVAGALLMMSRTFEMNNPDRVLFGQAVAAQIGQALAVTKAFSQQQASERLATEQAAVLRSILDSIADAVVVSDEAGQFIHWNPAADQMFGLARAPGADEARVDLFERDQTTPVSPNRLPVVRAMNGEHVEGMETFLRRAGAPEGIWLNVNARPWRDGSGRIRGGVAAFRDVTQEKAAQTQLMTSDRMASVGMLAAGVAHEINNPLATMIANLDLAQRELEQGALPSGSNHGLLELLNDARSAADRVHQIVRDLRIFSRHEELKPGAVDLQRVLESSARMAWNEIRHRARLVKEYGEVGPVVGTESRLGQVFLNLLVNAAQAIPDGNADKHSIRIVTRAAGNGRIAVEVTDTGSGIAPDQLPQLFTPFFTTKARGVGTGLGLAICQRIVTGLGGELQVESELGRGTTFRVLLREAPTARSAPPPARVAPAPSTKRTRILVIDDEPAIGTVIGRLLYEHDVTVTTSATDALLTIRSGERFDLILCDLMMPQMTGMDLHEQLGLSNPEQAERIVFLTGGAFTPAARAFLDSVHNPRVEKPFDPQYLRNLVNTSAAKDGPAHD